MAIKHKKNLAGASNGNPNQVQPGDWNDPHDLTGLLALLDTETVTPDRVLALGSDGLIQFLSKSTWLLALNAVLTGTPTAPTALAGTNTQQIATTAFVQAAINALIDAAPGALNTLDELAAALGDDANFAATITAALAAKAPLASPALTGNPTAPNQSALTNNTRIANTAYADAAVAALSALIVAGTTAVPGSIVGSSLTILSSFFTSSVAVPVDDTSPTNTEGDQILTTSFTPKSTTNRRAKCHRLDLCWICEHRRAVRHDCCRGSQSGLAHRLRVHARRDHGANHQRPHGRRRRRGVCQRRQRRPLVGRFAGLLALDRRDQGIRRHP
jgi:hypothetical protein